MIVVPFGALVPTVFLAHAVLGPIGDDKNYPTESAEMLATMIHLMRGTPYVYQGEEIAMKTPILRTFPNIRTLKA